MDTEAAESLSTHISSLCLRTLKGILAFRKQNGRAVTGQGKEEGTFLSLALGEAKRTAWGSLSGLCDCLLPWGLPTALVTVFPTLAVWRTFFSPTKLDMS